MCVFLYYYQYSMLLESSRVESSRVLLWLSVRTVLYVRTDCIVSSEKKGRTRSKRSCWLMGLLGCEQMKLIGWLDWMMPLRGRYVCTLLWWIVCCLKNEERTTATVPIDTIRFGLAWLGQKYACMPAPERASKRNQISHCVSQRLRLQLLPSKPLHLILFAAILIWFIQNKDKNTGLLLVIHD